jgi:hypothetical protein
MYWQLLHCSTGKQQLLLQTRQLTRSAAAAALSLLAQRYLAASVGVSIDQS